MVSEVSRRYDKKQPKHTDKRSFSYRLTKIKYLRDVYGQKIRRGIVYVTCGSLIFLAFLIYILTALLMPDLVSYLKLTFIVETISLLLFATAWLTASHVPYVRKIRLWLALRQKKQALVQEPGTA